MKTMCFADEGEAYARKLSEAGVRVPSVRYNGTIHDFVLLNPITNTPALRAAIQQANDALTAALRKMTEVTYEQVRRIRDNRGALRRLMPVLFI